MIFLHSELQAMRMPYSVACLVRMRTYFLEQLRIRTAEPLSDAQLQGAAVGLLAGKVRQLNQMAKERDRIDQIYFLRAHKEARIKYQRQTELAFRLERINDRFDLRRGA